MCLVAIFVAVFGAAVVAAEGYTTCQIGTHHVVGGGQCPVKLTPARSYTSGGFYAECVTVRVWVKKADFRKSPKVEILSQSRAIIRPTLKRKRERKKLAKRNPADIEVMCTKQRQWSNATFALWELVYQCVEAKAEKMVRVSYSTTSERCSVNYTVPDPVPDFRLSVSHSSKSVNITVERGEKVMASWCYRGEVMHCVGSSDTVEIAEDPSRSRSALLTVPYRVPCVCVQVYYAHTDSRRHTKCPFQNNSLINDADVLRSSEVTLFRSKMTWSSECPVRDLKISASLCWRQQEHLCTPVLNFTLEGKESGSTLIYNTSALDTHPRMCVKFSRQGSHEVSCPFQAALSSWEVHISPAGRSALLRLTSSVPATFSAQLCVLNESGCTSTGEVYSVKVEAKSTDRGIEIPLHVFAGRPCVQVWRSDPALNGRRVLCPDYKHRRHGLYAVVALVFFAVCAFLGIRIRSLTKKKTSDWLCVQKPVLLVCSSEQSAHVSAACLLASLLQGELNASVHMALRSQSSQRLGGGRAGVAELGPLPWLYGQWEAVRRAQGKVLIVWSGEAKDTYERWRNDGDGEEREGDLKPNAKRLGKGRQENAPGKKDCTDLREGEERHHQTNSSVIEAVFTAALVRLEGVRQQGKDQGVAFVYFQGLSHSRDIPKAFRCVPRYCLPQDFSGLIQELGGLRRWSEKDTFQSHCWPRLVSKGLSLWLARQLTHRLRTLLPRPQARTRPGPRPSPPAVKADRTRRGKDFPSAAPGNLHEREALCKT